MLNKNNISIKMLSKYTLTIAIVSMGLAIVAIIIITIIRSLNNKANITKAEADTIGASYVAIAITGDNNTNGNINLTIDPTKKNNIAVGSHTLITTSNNVAGYNISLQTTTNNNNLVNQDNPNATIKPIDSTKEQPKPLENKTWGYAIASREDGGSNNTTTPTTFSPVRPKSQGNNAEKTIISSQTPTPVSGASTTIYYGVSLFDVDIAQYAGTYRTTVEYTAVANPALNPVVINITPKEFQANEQFGNKSVVLISLTIVGRNLNRIKNIYVDWDDDGLEDGYEKEKCYYLQIQNNDKINCFVQIFRNTKIGKHIVYLIDDSNNVINAGVIDNLEPLCNANPSSKVKVDIDNNMIPVIFKGNQNDDDSGWVKADVTNKDNDWYNYDNKIWANAITVSDPSKYKDSPAGTSIQNSDVKGYWVYIPRFDYCSMGDSYDRGDDYDYHNNYDGVRSALTTSPQNFEISFKTSTDKIVNPDIAYKNTWRTHPAFTYNNTELNGIWVGKFELTGSRNNPTILPNKPSNTFEQHGSFINIINSIGNQGMEIDGNCDETSGGCLPAKSIKFNQHNLFASSSIARMIKKEEWGAIAYLSSSQHGAGVNNVQMNAAYSNRDDDDGDYSYSITGCGPLKYGNDEDYLSDKNKTACADISRQYTGSIGQTASTTGNIYGIYDMAGGAWEFMNSSFYDYRGHGEAIFETRTAHNVSWGDDGFSIDMNNDTRGSDFYMRGGSSYSGSYAGIFAITSYDGKYDSASSRAIMIVMPK